jgi:exonuclease VII large subunit
MKSIAYVWLAVTILAGSLTTLAGAQSEPLGDYARAVRKEKKQEKLESGKRFDNDNLPKTDTLSVVGKAADQSAPSSSDAASPAAQDKAQSDQKADDSSKMGESKPGEPAKDRQKMYDEWKKKITAQQEQVNLLTREMDVMQREYRLRAAAFYADAGNRLRNAGSWDKEDAQYKQQLAEKQKTLDAAKEELQDLRERARKAGVPSSMNP